MKIVCKSLLKRSWKRHPEARGLVLEKDIQLQQSRLRAKLLVFETPKALRRFWKNGLKNGDLGRHCVGAVNGLRTEVSEYDKPKRNKGRKLLRKYLEVDHRYFCVIGLSNRNLGQEIITHESIHAGFAYAKRVRRSPWDAKVFDFDEEAVCYPSGLISSAITMALYDSRLLPDPARNK